MVNTVKAKRAKRKKILTRRLKEQDRNAKKIAKRREKIKKKLWEFELDDLKDTGLLQGLTWEFMLCVELFNVTATGFRSKEDLSNKAVKKIQHWFWDHLDNEGRLDHVILSRKRVDQHEILLGLQMSYADDDECDVVMVIEIFALDVHETGTGVPTEKAVLKKFAEQWNIEVDIQ